ncbi:hypothetical protein AB0G64_09600 [Streptomyces longwoodensis]|uniref:DUF7144 family membrane protein n=1 Tax=Streptomyces longwoodensis TaxID=68231 RepID=UPI0033D1E8EC
MTSGPDPAPGEPRGEIGTAWSVPRGGPRPPAPPPPPAPPDGGGAALAAVLMLCSGLLAVLQGVAAVAGDDVYARTGAYAFRLGLAGWGWIHLTLGALLALTGAGVLRGVARARPAGVVLAALGLVAQFLFLPYEPLWSVVVMGLDLFVIRALVVTRHRT